MKRVLSVFLAIILFIGIIPLSNLGLKAMAGTNGHTQAEAIAWAEAQTKNPRDYDGTAGIQCPDLIKMYYVYLGYYAVKGNGAAYATNEIPCSTWNRYSYYNGFIPQPGDVACWTYSTSSDGHVAIVLSANSSGMTVAEFLGSNHTGRTHWYSYSYGTLACFIRPDFNGSSTPANLGDDFYAYIGHPDLGKWVANINNNVQCENASAYDNQIWHFIRRSDGTYSIISQKNGYAMDVSNALTTPGTNLQMMPYVDNVAQRFYVYSEYGYAWFKCSYANIWFDVNYDNLNVKLEYETGYLPQKFIIQKCDVNGNLPQNLGSEFDAYIEHPDLNKRVASINNNVQCENFSAFDNQLWHFIRQNNGAYNIISKETGYAMDVSNALTTPGTNLHMMPYVNNVAQRFYIYKINGYYFFKSSYADIWFDVNYDSFNVKFENLTGYNAQKFTIDLNLENKNTLKICYDCYNGFTTNIDTSKGFYFGDYNRLCSSAEPHREVDGTQDVYYQLLDYNSTVGADGLRDFADFGLSAPKGYKFAGWKSGYNGKVFDETTTIYTAADFIDELENGYDHVWLTAQYEPASFIVTFVNGSYDITSKTVTYNSTYGTLPIPTRNGYTFTGWYTAASGGTKIESSTKVTITSNQTLYAHWSANSYTVSFNANGGNCETSSKTVTYNSTYGDLPIPTREGYTFDGWYTEEIGGDLVTSDTIVTATADHTLYAHWSRFGAKDGSTAVIDGSYIYGLKTKLTSGNLKNTFLDSEGVEVTYTKAIEEARYYGTGSTVTVTHSDGTEEVYTIIIFGDVDGNGIIDSDDAYATLAAAVDNSLFDAVQKKAANVDGVRRISVDDYAIINDAVLGISDIDQTAI